jgi:site-specific DNA-methyltransferase (adenine-specific)
MNERAPYYDEDGITIYHGDNRDVLPALGQFDLIFTSPPYNLGTNPGGVFGHWKDGGRRGGMGAWSKDNPSIIVSYDCADDALPYPVYRDQQRQTIGLCWDHLSDVGAIFYNHKPRVQRAGLLLPLDLIPRGPILRQIVVWDRGGGCNFVPTAYTAAHEWIIVLAREQFRLKGAGAALDVWRVAAQPSEHPAPFPVELPARAIETAVPRSVLDPFAGSGTTLVAAKAAGVPAVGIEKSERYCEMAARRLAQGSLFGAAS